MKNSAATSTAKKYVIGPEISKSASEDERRRLTGAKKTMPMETATLTVTTAQG